MGRKRVEGNKRGKGWRKKKKPIPVEPKNTSWTSNKGWRLEKGADENDVCCDRLVRRSLLNKYS